MASSQLKDCELFVSVQEIYAVFGFGLVHIGVHNSAFVPIFPIVQPDIFVLISDYLSNSAVVARVIELFFLRSFFGQCICSLIST